MAGETFLQVLQICKGKAPGREKDEGQAILCLTSFCVSFYVFSGWAKLGQARWRPSTSHRSVSVPLEVKFWYSKCRGRLCQVIQITKSLVSVTREVVNIFIDINYLVTSFAFLLEWLRLQDEISLHFVCANRMYLSDILSLANFLPDTVETKVNMTDMNPELTCAMTEPLRGVQVATGARGGALTLHQTQTTMWEVTKSNLVPSALVHSTFLVWVRDRRLRYERA